MASESDILTPRDPSREGENSDEWPEFTLSHAHVHLPGQPDFTESLLEASAGYPLVVVGQLEPPDPDNSHLYNKQRPGKKRIDIILERVVTFSYGLYGDGSYGFWAAGKAGWFKLKPAKKYKATFDGMAEAVKLLYFCSDTYGQPARKKGRGKSAQVLPDYSAAELFEKYAAEEMDSSDPSDGMEKFYEHKGFLISCMISGKEGLAWSKYPLYGHMHRKFPELFDKLRQRLSAPAPAGREVGQSNHKRQASEGTTSSVSALTRKRGRKANVKGSAVEVISLDGTSEADSTRRGSKQPVDELTELLATTASSTRTSRKTRQNSVAGQTEVDSVEGAVTTPTKDDDTDEEIRLRSRKNKSSLRPRASKASKSAGRKGGKGPAMDEDDEDDQPDPPSSPMAGKRKMADRDTPVRPLKRRHSRPHDDEGIDIPTSPSVSGDGENAELPPGGTSELAIRGVEGHAPDPVQEDTWLCALDGCSHKVYAASHPDSQKLIREHYNLHAFDEDERVQMVKRLAAPSLPTSHLLEKVKMQAKMEAFPGSRQMSSRYLPTLPVAQRY
ncbi:Hypothetical predicted protein [Lecanosticta acicola]|uniref:Uncharacterized protein n=1 Tax=Lecanosticta acicola TaxID=111012 RepID=A0AAI9EFB9_9PEZI|nr:Hypothetical predicted protein [Lecanosticta acicola]